MLLSPGFGEPEEGGLSSSTMPHIVRSLSCERGWISVRETPLAPSSFAEHMILPFETKLRPAVATLRAVGLLQVVMSHALSSGATHSRDRDVIVNTLLGSTVLNPAQGNQAHRRVVIDHE